LKETQDNATRDYLGPLYFAAVAVAAWGPALFSNGYILLSDMVFTPAMHPPTSLLGPVRSTLNVTLLYSLAWVLARLMGAVLLQKAVLFLMAFLPGYLAYRNVPCRRRWARLFAGTLYAVNPFVYTRMIMGQWGLLLGYALLPVALASTLKTAREPSAGRCARTALWLALTAALSLHMGAVAVLVCAVAGIFELASRPRRRRAALALAAVAVLLLVLSSFWLLPAFRGGDLTGSVGKADLEAFKTRSTSRAGTWLSVAGLYGYWKTAIDGLLPRNYVPLWPLFAVGLLALSLYGFWSYRRDRVNGPLVKALLVIGVLGFFLALGSRAPVTGPVFTFVYDHLSAFRVFREPQKFAAMLVLAYAVLGGLGVERLAERFELAGDRRSAGLSGDAGTGRSRRSWLVPLLLLALVCFYSFRMFGGLWGEARAVSYPRSWARAQQLLNRDRGDWRVLYLPNYWYMSFDFAGGGRAINSPMPFYFTNPYVQLNALVVGGVQVDRQPVDAYIQASLESARKRGNLGAMLAPLDVKYVLMPLNIASSHFRFVEEQEDLQVVGRWRDLVLLRNRVPVSRVVLAGSTGSYASWEALGKQASGGNLLGSFLPQGGATSVPQATGEPLIHQESATEAITAVLPPTRGAGSTVLFSELYSPDWRATGAGAARRQVGVVTAFPLERAANGSVTIRYFNVLLVVGYAVSGIGLLLCAILIARERLSIMRSKRDSK
jgi:hypothetical protein